MRILMLSQFYRPTIGGEEQHVYQLSHALAARGHQVAIATFWRAGLPEFEKEQGVAVYRIPSTAGRVAWLFQETERRHAPPLPDPEAVNALRRIIQHERPEVVHGHNWLVHSFLPLKQWSGAKLIVTLHDYSLLCAQKRLMQHGTPCSGPGVAKCLRCSQAHYGALKGMVTLFSNWVMGAAERRMVDLFLPVSQAVAAGNGLTGSTLPFAVLPNFLPDRAEAPVADVSSYLAQLPTGDFLLFVGDLSRDKGLHTLLDAYAGLAVAPPLVLIGRTLPETPTALPPNVINLGKWPHQAVLQAFRRCLLALAPSLWPEPFGFVVLEALASGRPVIATRTGGLIDLVSDGDSGLLVPPGDVIALRAAIQRLLTDLPLRTHMGKAGLKRAKAFLASSVAPQIEEIYRQVVFARHGLQGEIVL